MVMTEVQPLDLLDAWLANLSPPRDGYGKGWITWAAEHCGVETGDDARVLAERAVDLVARERFKGNLDCRIDEAAARELIELAKRVVRPRPLMLRPERRISRSELQRRASASGVRLDFPKKDAPPPRHEEGQDHKMFWRRAAGILQDFGHVFIGAVGVGGLGYADLAIVSDSGVVALVEAMNGVSPDDELRSWRTKKAFANDAITKGCQFLFVGSTPPWVPTERGKKHTLRTPNGRRVVEDWFPSQGTYPPPDARVLFTEPEELDEHDELVVARLFARE